MKEWEQYKIKGDLAAVGAKLNTVRHIVHVPAARRIIEDRKIKAGLVYDESRFNRSRISVTWVSANTWAFGSIYGTVEFQFDWKTLVEDQKVYWVEAMEKYNPTAYRFLLTSREPRELGSGSIEPYDPTKDDGPLRKSGDQWYWNGEFTSEFMIDDDLLLRHATGLDFVRHHGQFCRSFGTECVDRKQNPTPDETGGRILAHILAHELRVIDTYLKPTAETPRNHLLDTAFAGLHSALIEGTEFGGGLHRPVSCEKVVTGALALYGMDQLDAALHLLTLLKSADGFDKALVEIVRQHFGVMGWTAPF
jgi:hypothetical protein